MKPLFNYPKTKKGQPLKSEVIYTSKTWGDFNKKFNERKEWKTS